MEIHPFSARFLFAQSCLTDAVIVIFSDYCFPDTRLNSLGGSFAFAQPRISSTMVRKIGRAHV